MADQTTNVQQITAGTNADTRINENFDAASPAMLYGRRASVTTGLTWGYYGGRFGSTSIANGTVTLTASQTNYIVASRTTGAVSVSTSATNWGNSADYLRLYKVTTGTSTVSDYEDHRQAVGAAGATGAGENTPIAFGVACSDETTALSTGVAKITFHWPYEDTELTQVFAGLSTVQTGGSTFTVDVNASGASILSTKITIDNGEETSLTAAAPPVFATGSPTPAILTKGEKVTIDIDQIGDGTAKGLKVYFRGRLV